MRANPDPWSGVWHSLRLLRVDPCGLGGVVLRARAGPARDACLAALPGFDLPVRRLHPAVSDTELFASLDVSATLLAGRPMATEGLLEGAAELRLVMAERCPIDLAAKLAIRMEAQPNCCLIACDEGVDPEEKLPDALADRLAFHLELEGLRPCLAPVFEEDIRAIRQGLRHVQASPDDITALTLAATQLGIFSMRAPLLALRTARCNAALSGRDYLGKEDLECAAKLVFAHRATCLPELPQTPDRQEHPPLPEEDISHAQNTETDLLLEAVRTVLPDGILPQNAHRNGGKGQGAGSTRNSTLRGRPVPPRRRRPDGRSRIDLIATLRRAAPWQKLRAIPGRRLTILPTDICLKRFEERSERLLIFLVDASGSAAHARLSEAKGAVEHLLADAYSHRDRVAMIGFRNRNAEVLLPPNRSLVLAKRRLASLPGGGATPLADGLQSGGQLADKARKNGLTPTLILLTDGRANVALDGSYDRHLAMLDAERTADWIRRAQMQSLVLDTGIRPQRALCSLADRMGATHLALPRSDTAGLTRAIHDATLA